MFNDAGAFVHNIEELVTSLKTMTLMRSMHRGRPKMSKQHPMISQTHNGFGAISLQRLTAQHLTWRRW
jgi:hypothetical protein